MVISDSVTIAAASRRHRLDGVLARGVVDVDVDLAPTGHGERRRPMPSTSTPSFCRKKQRSWTM
jgi:hypothetical protein